MVLDLYVFAKRFVDHCLSFCHVSFGHCSACPSSTSDGIGIGVTRSSVFHFFLSIILFSLPFSFFGLFFFSLCGFWLPYSYLQAFLEILHTSLEIIDQCKPLQIFWLWYHKSVEWCMFLWASGLSISTIGISYHLFSTQYNDN